MNRSKHLTLLIISRFLLNIFLKHKILGFITIFFIIIYLNNFQLKGRKHCYNTRRQRNIFSIKMKHGLQSVHRHIACLFFLMSRGKPASSKGGLIIYLNERFIYQLLESHKNVEKWECQINKISGNLRKKQVI